MQNTIEMNWELSLIELAEMEWWENNPNATQTEFQYHFWVILNS